MALSPEDRRSVEQIAAWLREAQAAVAFTGAGISTESGIPDFRSPGGFWSKNRPVYFPDFMASAEARYEHWRQKCEAHVDFAKATPNVGHEVLARWESAGVLKAVITQNIDGLHQQAGSRRILELHDTAREIGCLDCGARFDPEPLLDEFRATDSVPLCERCGGRLKTATISFGQQLPTDVLYEASGLSGKADVFLAIGSSLVVEPAASLPGLAKQRGARLVIINRDPTAQDHLADCVLHTPIGESLAAIDAGIAASAES